MKRSLAIGGIALALLGVTLAGVRAWPRAPLATRIPASVAVFDVRGRLLRLTLARDQQYRVWTPLSNVPPPFIEALLLHEDRRFYRHPGVDVLALVRAVRATRNGHRQGGSTLTMQLARLLYGLDTRTVRGKLRQIGLAVALELRYSKRELLEAHLNLMPYGGNVQGVGAASLIYFGKPPAALSLSEMLALVVVPQSPAIRAPASGEPAPLTAARLRLFGKWLERHPDAGRAADAMKLPSRYAGARELPFAAPHFVDALLAESGNRQDGRRAEAAIHGTLDLGEQRVIERVVRGFIAERRRVGVDNAAVLLVDARDMSVRAAMGSARFGDDAISGQVNGTLAKRSPGSTLKPFVYALAIDQGLIHPLTVLKDAPTAFGPFSPENFDGRFMGPLSATQALIRSRNVPAVALSARLSQPSFYQFLQGAGISRLAPQSRYGLSLVLGGAEVTMEEMGTLYAMLANRGLLQPLRHRVDEPGGAATRLLSQEAAFMTIAMLEQNPRPDAAGPPPPAAAPVAWKTGTSWGFRDAWSAGLFGPYVLVVWVGRFDGGSNPAFVGAETAAPLFFRIIDALRGAESVPRDIVPGRPAGLARVEICAASGDLPNADCPQRATTWFIPGRSPIRVSDVHRRVWVDARTGLAACPPYDARFVHAEVFEYWSSDVLELFAQAGLPRRTPPAPAHCARLAAGPAGARAPRISSPRSNSTYTLRAARIRSDVIPLSASTDGGARTVYWFVDGAYLGAAAPDTPLEWCPGRSGSFLVRAVDEEGRADSRELLVAVVP